MVSNESQESFFLNKFLVLFLSKIYYVCPHIVILNPFVCVYRSEESSCASEISLNITDKIRR